MKRIIFVIFALFVAACGDKGDSNSGGGQVANTPLDTSCYNGSVNCNNTAYNQYYQYGWQAYPGFQPGYNYVNQFQNYGLCNCPVGSRPVYNSYNGLGCVSDYYLMPIMSYSLYWQIGFSNYSYSYPAYGYGYEYPSNRTQVSNIPNGTTQNVGSGCYNNVIQSCHLDMANSCGTGATCRVTAAASRMGVCVRN